MRKPFAFLAALLISTGLSACGQQSGTAPVNIDAVLDRVSKTLVDFDAYLRRYDYKSVDQAMYDQFNKTIQHSLNAQPRFHTTAIVTTIRDDASIIAHGDLDNDGRASAQEPTLFRIEMDPDNNRVIITSAASGATSGRIVPGGFFAGVMVGSMLNRQRAAGIAPGHFNSRSLANAPAKNTKLAQGSVARGGARSGGLRAGK